MSIVSINWRPSDRELRWFAGLWFPAFWAIVGLLVAVRTGRWELWLPLGGVLILVAGVGLVWPRFMRPVFVAWMCAAFPIGWIVSHFLLAVVYYLLITPLGLMMRVVGRDKLNSRIDRQAPTYFIRRPPPLPPSRYFRQF